MPRQKSRKIRPRKKKKKGDRNYLRDKASDLTKHDFKVTITNKFMEQRKSMIKKERQV